MHRTPNNAQNTQHKLGVAFSYLERKNLYFTSTIGSLLLNNLSGTMSKYFNNEVVFNSF